MRKAKKCYELLSHLIPGRLYSWNVLRKHSNSLGRDLKRLLDEGLLKKVGPGLYLFPKKGRFGSFSLPVAQLVARFLKTNDFLMFSTLQYNTLGLGLSQLKNQVIVYNHKRHEKVLLGDKEFHFKRPNNFFPDKLTKEFLLLDLMNNIKLTGEPEDKLKEKVISAVRAGQFTNRLLFSLANKYGKVGTKKFFNQFIFDNKYPGRKWSSLEF